MNKAQIAVLSVAVLAGGVAFVMMNGSSPPPVQQVAAPAPVRTEEVLVATRDLSYGSALADTDTSWIAWPVDGVPKGALSKSEAPNAKEDIKTSFVRIPISAGEPIRRERLIKGQTAGLMSTMLASGKRAIAIDVDVKSTAGGFVLPNDRVDLIRTFRDQEATKERGVEVMSSEVVLSNVRVLAVGQNIETKNGESVISGATATLELDPRQAELVILAQRTGQLALALRALVDSGPRDSEAPKPDSNDDTLTIVRYGVSSNLRSK
jgi:pilus assembly protein CpaB